MGDGLAVVASPCIRGVLADVGGRLMVVDGVHVKS